MLNFVVRRLLLMIPTLVLITAVVFAVVKLAPGNPFSAMGSAAESAARQMSPDDYRVLLERYGLDRPWYVQYGRWLGNLLSGSLGQSFSERQSVLEVFFSGGTNSKFFATLWLNLLAMAVMTAIAIPVGIRSAIRPGGFFDRASGSILYVLYSLPNFWIAILLIILLGVQWRLLPFIGMRSDGYEALGPLARLADFVKHAALPATCLAYGGLAYMARFTRAAFLDTLGQDYIRTARAKGLSGGAVLWRHAFPNALIPLLTLAGLLLPALISGSVIIESIFSWPGLGRLYVQAIYTRDYPIIMAMSLLGALAVLLSNLLTDLAYAAADPRVRLS